MEFTVSITTARMLFGRPALFAARDDARPVLTGVYVEAEARGTVIASAADGFRIGTQIVKGVEVKEAGKAIVPYAVIQQALKAFPKNANGTVKVSVDSHTVSLMCSVPEPSWGAPHEVTFTGDLIPGKFPDIRSLIAGANKRTGMNVALDAHFLAVFEKVARLDPSGSGITRIYTGAPTEPVMFQIKDEMGGGFIGLVMPIYVNWNAEDDREALFAELGIGKPKTRQKKAA